MSTKLIGDIGIYIGIGIMIGIVQWLRYKEKVLKFMKSYNNMRK